MRRTSALGRSFASGAGAIIALVLAPGALWGDVTPPSISWEMPISLSRNDSARSLALSSDGVVVAVESETSASEKTTSIIAIDNSGELAWERVLGSNLHTPVLTEALSSTGDVDGYLVAARRYFPAEHGALIRVDVDGAPLWEKSFELREGWISAIASTKDGGALLFGTSDRAAFAMRFDADGEERFRFEHASGSFQVFLSGTEILGATGLVEGHVVVGPGPHAFGLSATGERRWMTRLGADLGAGSAYAAIARVDGSVRVAGTLDRGGGRGATTRDRLIAELDAGGGITAERFLPGDDHEHACGLIDRGDGRVVLFGSRRAVDAPLGDDRPHIEEIGPS
ncbi:MAG TPA: PQQ-binding-like beta-propeller repeat protein, partial [Planctomycetota bacterium]|nr:PQQ-binding-like beta-propeller repeat protein [Planctomycetota bacterium]